MEDTVKLVKGIGGKCYGYVVDLAKKEDIYRVAKQVDQDVGRVSKQVKAFLTYHTIIMPNYSLPHRVLSVSQNNTRNLK